MISRSTPGCESERERFTQLVMETRGIGDGLEQHKEWRRS